MAVTKLKLFSISGSLKDFATALYICINDPFLHIEDAANILKDIHGIVNIVEHNLYQELLSSIEKLASAAGIDLADKFKPRDIIVNERVKMLEYEVPQINTEGADYEIHLQSEKLKQQLELIQKETNLISENKRIVEQLERIKHTSVNLSDLFKLEFSKFRFGHMPREAYDSISMYTNDLGDFFFIPSSIEQKEVWGMYLTPRTKSVKIDSLFKTLHFQRVRISDKVQGTPEKALKELLSETEEATARLETAKIALQAEKEKAFSIIEKYYEKVLLLSSMFELRKKVVRTSTSFHMMAWMPKSGEQKLKEQFGQLSVIITPIDTSSDPIAKPPTLLKNFSLFKPFEQFVEMYGLPSYNEIDPTPFIAVTYILFFGLMFGDVGQGLVITLGGYFLWFKRKINLGRIAGLLGISSMIFGVVFGSVFGIENIIHGYNPIEHINTVLFGAVGLGIVTISTAIICNIINGVRQKNYEKIFFSQNGIAGLILYWAVAIAALMVANFVKLNISLAIFIVIAIICVITIYLREPLSNLVAKNKKLISHKPSEFLIVNLFEVLEIVLSFLTNTISFIRIGAFALNHVGMMTVVMLLAETADGGINPAVLIIGNIVVICLEGLIVGIQCLRLEYYEIFGRFFEGNGRRFEHSGLDNLKTKK